jgi:hypothetical protein
MTTTVVLQNMPALSTTATVSMGIASLDRADFILREYTPATAKTAATAEFVYAPGDPAKETTVTIKWRSDAQGIHCSLRLLTAQTTTVDEVVDSITQAPVDVVIAWNLPSFTSIPLDINAMIFMAVALLTGATDVGGHPQAADSLVAAISRGLIQSGFGG